MRQIKVRVTAGKAAPQEIDLRSPSGRGLPF
jgi:hypothetical protein